MNHRRPYRRLWALLLGTTSLFTLPGLAAASATSTPQRLAPRTDAISVTPSLVLTDARFAVKGELTRAAAGALATLEVKRGKKWLPIRTQHLTAGSTFSFSLIENRPGRMAFRVVANKSSRSAVRVSSTVVESVAVWHYLSDLTNLYYDHALGLGSGSVEISGIAYPHSVIGHYFADSTIVGEYNLQRRCITLSAVAGVDDNSPDNGAVSAEVSTDSSSVFSQTVSLGAPKTVQLPMTNVLRLTLDFVTGSSWSYSDTVAFGNAKVLCTF